MKNYFWLVKYNGDVEVIEAPNAREACLRAWGEATPEHRIKCLGETKPSNKALKKAQKTDDGWFSPAVFVSAEEPELASV